MKSSISRRRFLETTSIAGAAVSLGLPTVASSAPQAGAESSPAKPAVLGGSPAHTGSWPGWPVFDQVEEKALLDTVRSGQWFRYYPGGGQVARFEEAYAKRAGAKNCLGTSSGTSSLYIALGALGIGPGDEVILPPYTFVATYNVVVLNYALPIFVDVDLESFQLDPAKLDRAITPNTKAIIPVHIGGNTADLDAVLAVAKKHNVPVIEDACQAHLSEWRGRMVGNWGLCGCFSFQASKNLNSGEGGAILTNDEEFAGRCELFHDQGRSRRSGRGGGDFTYAGNRGTNMRMTEWQGAMLLAQMTRLEEQSSRRWENARFLNKALAGIPGIAPARLYEGCTRSAYHLYMFRYNKEVFGGLEHGKFVQALNREGVPCSAGYSPLNADRYVASLFNNNRHYQRLYSKEVQERWQAQCQCPVNDKLCSQAVWFTQNILLGSHGDMEQIVEAVARIKSHAAAIAKA